MSFWTPCLTLTARGLSISFIPCRLENWSIHTAISFVELRRLLSEANSPAMSSSLRSGDSSKSWGRPKTVLELHRSRGLPREAGLRLQHFTVGAMHEASWDS